MPDKKYKLTVLKDAQGKYVVVDGKRYRLPNDSRITNKKFKQIIIRNVINNNTDKKITIRRRRKPTAKVPDVPASKNQFSAPASVSAPITVANPFYETDKIKMNAESEKLKDKYTQMEKEQKTVLERLEQKSQQEKEKNNQQLLEFQQRLNHQAIEYNDIRNDFIRKLQDQNNADPVLVRHLMNLDRRIDDMTMALNRDSSRIIQQQENLLSGNASTTQQERIRLLGEVGNKLMIGPKMSLSNRPKLSTEKNPEYLERLNVSNMDLQEIISRKLTAEKLINFLHSKGYNQPQPRNNEPPKTPPPKTHEPKIPEPKTPEPKIPEPKIPEPKIPEPKIPEPVQQPKMPEKPKGNPPGDSAQLKQLRTDLEKVKSDIGNAINEMKKIEVDIGIQTTLLSKQKNIDDRSRIQKKIDDLTLLKQTIHQRANEFATQNRKIEQEINDEMNKQNGQGRITDNNGIYSDEIDKFMNVFAPRNYLGAVSYDRLPNILELSFIPKEFSIIINEDSTSEPGSHWVCIFKTPKNIEYYDPFGKPPIPEIKQFITALAKKLNNNIQIKINQIPNQSINSSNCGYLCMRFIVDRYAGESFIQATHYDSVQKSEREVERWKDKILNFESI